MVTPIDRAEVRRLVAVGAQLVEVLPRHEFDEEHLPGAISVPLKDFSPEALTLVNRDRAVIVYCWDGL